MYKQEEVPMPVGAVSLLTIFAVLCLLTFSLLSLSTANANKKLADKSADAINSYYKADVEAQQILSKLREGVIPKQVEKKTDTIYCYECEISETKSLFVEVMVDSKSYDIQKWKVVSKIDWEADDSIKVWDGQIEE